MVLYSITLIPLAEELCAAVPGFLVPSHAYSAVSDELSYTSSSLMTLLLEWGPRRGYFPEPSKS